MKTRKIWLGIGAAALTTTAPSVHAPVQAAARAIDAATARALLPSASDLVKTADSHSHGAAPKDTAKSGAEGGEGGESSSAKDAADARLDPYIRFYRDVQLVRGHLLVGDELVKLGLWKDALPHFLHPTEELYDKLEPHIKLLKLKPFKQQLKALTQTVKANNAKAYAEALKALNARLAIVDSGMKAEMKSEKKVWLPFAVETAVETLRSAIGEYEESIDKGKFTKAVEYQDSRGFVLQGEVLLKSVSEELKAKYPADFAKAEAQLAELKKAWPAPVPPAAPVLELGQVASEISRIELSLGTVK